MILAVLIAGVVFISNNLRNRHPGYSVDLSIQNSPENDLMVGFAAIPITPDIPDQWDDVNGDAQYNPGDGDTYTDGNGNGKFDAVWIAGFSAARRTRPHKGAGYPSI